MSLYCKRIGYLNIFSCLMLCRILCSVIRVFERVKIMKKIILCMLLLSISTVALSEEMAGALKPKHSIGLSLGWVVANGLSYRQYLADDFVQLTFAGAVDKDKDEEYIDASISYSRYLNKFDLNQGRFPVGLKWLTGIELERDIDRSQDLVSKTLNVSPNEIHVGSGFGFDFGSPGRRGMIYSFDVIYTASFRDFKNREFVRLGLLPSISLHYNM